MSAQLALFDAPATGSYPRLAVTVPCTNPRCQACEDPPCGVCGRTKFAVYSGGAGPMPDGSGRSYRFLMCKKCTDGYRGPRTWVYVTHGEAAA